MTNTMNTHEMLLSEMTLTNELMLAMTQPGYVSPLIFSDDAVVASADEYVYCEENGCLYALVNGSYELCTLSTASDKRNDPTPRTARVIGQN